MTDLNSAIQSAIIAGRTFAAANPEGPNWYPCGFAWLTYKCRKNGAESKALIANGFRWGDYEKRYMLSGGTFSNTQSMYYKESILRVVQESLKEAGYTFDVQTRID
jgi:hypothetical protein